MPKNAYYWKEKVGDAENLVLRLCLVMCVYGYNLAHLKTPFIW